MKSVNPWLIYMICQIDTIKSTCLFTGIVLLVISIVLKILTICVEEEDLSTILAKSFIVKKYIKIFCITGLIFIILSTFLPDHNLLITMLSGKYGNLTGFIQN